MRCRARKKVSGVRLFNRSRVEQTRWCRRLGGRDYPQAETRVGVMGSGDADRHRQAGRFARFCEILGGQKSLGGVSSVVYQANRCRDCDMTGGLLRLCAHGCCLSL